MSPIVEEIKIKSEVIRRLKEELKACEELLHERPNNLLLLKKIDELKNDYKIEVITSKFTPKVINVITDSGWLADTTQLGKRHHTEDWKFRERLDRMILDSPALPIFKTLLINKQGMFRYEIQKSMGYIPVRRIQKGLNYLRSCDSVIRRFSQISYAEQFEPPISKVHIDTLFSTNLKARNDEAYKILIESIKNYSEVELISTYPSDYILKSSDKLIYQITLPHSGIIILTNNDKNLELSYSRSKKHMDREGSEKIEYNNALSMIEENFKKNIAEKMELRKKFGLPVF